MGWPFIGLDLLRARLFLPTPPKEEILLYDILCFIVVACKGGGESCKGGESCCGEGGDSACGACPVDSADPRAAAVQDRSALCRCRLASMYIQMKRNKTTYFIQCEPTETALSIKQKLCAMIDQPPSNQQLVLLATNDVLEDSKTLGDQKVENDSTVGLALRKEANSPLSL
ncbi:hypothetical protein U9M48_044780 [Paspalum notatum var. saurae]|uniref:Ubiquitin-like domain-containing protein n=1 Tax=Paspalum notatum var. saurae TaxID=547442 RepID=A0AAQ3V0D0_PASNO